MPFTPEQHKRYRQKLRERGVCTVCHKEKAKGSVCKGCYNRIKTYRYAKRKEGRCHDCLKKLDEYTVAVGHTRCQTCAERSLVMRRRWYEANKS